MQTILYLDYVSVEMNKKKWMWIFQEIENNIALCAGTCAFLRRVDAWNSGRLLIKFGELI